VRKRKAETVQLDIVRYYPTSKLPFRGILKFQLSYCPEQFSGLGCKTSGKFEVCNPFFKVISSDEWDEYDFDNFCALI